MAQGVSKLAFAHFEKTPLAMNEDEPLDPLEVGNPRAML